MRSALVALVLVAPARADEMPAFEIELTAPKAFYPDEVPDIKCAIRNAGKGDGFVLRPVDGAFDGLRALVTYRERVTFNGQVQPRRTDLRRIDNFVNAIRPADLVAVKAGTRAAVPTGDATQYYQFATPGKYTFALTYEFDPTADDKIEGAGFAKALRALPAAQATAKVEFSVLPFPPAVAAAEDALKTARARHQIATTFAEAVAKDPTATAQQRDLAAERVKRATATVTAATDALNEKMAAFRKERAAERQKAGEKK